ncbi:protein of unknown function [Alkalimonas amylolytica]|uniref:Uncharacterized protein n=1 Tax=Alkalimonas amylolytica TaxID=152573 RepID=A0A1H4DA54_ALKAM|nr:protein of unknown function [Alkalimonas amylolytica]
MRAFLHIFLLFLAGWLTPATGATHKHFQQQASQQQLYQSPYWHALLHYKKSRIHKQRVKSELLDPEFFLAKDGAINPETELLATIEAILSQPGDDHNAHASCRFIARTHWLEQQLPGFAQARPATKCELFEQWAQPEQLDSVSLVFASGYLGNPASFYGHILLKLNSSNPSKTYLQHQSLNYGAAVPDQENPVAYIIKGLFGGYQSTFSYGEFYKNSLTYGEHELRDLWEYQLNLTDGEVLQLTYHAWELIGRHHTYYFLKENCAFRMAQLLELIIDARLKPDLQPWAMPISVFHALSVIEQHGQPLISAIKLHPSRQHRFYQKYQQLNAAQKQAVAAIIQNDFKVHSLLDPLPSPEQQAQVLEALFDYVEFAYLGEPEIIQQKKQGLLQTRLMLPVLPQAPFPQPEQFPHQSTRPSMWQLQASSKSDKFIPSMRFRAAYYDLLTAQTGQPPFSGLGMFDVTLAREGQRFVIQQFELLRIEQMNLSTTGLPADSGFAWKVAIGYRPLTRNCSDCRHLYAEGGLGKAIRFQEHGIVYALLDGRLHPAGEQLNLVSAVGRLGAIIDIHPGWRSQLELGWNTYALSNHQSYGWYRWHNRFGQSPDWDIRLSLDNTQNATRWSLSYSRYW